eukprot:6382832-Amphidinium_carterae.1
MMSATWLLLHVSMCITSVVESILANTTLPCRLFAAACGCPGMSEAGPQSQVQAIGNAGTTEHRTGQRSRGVPPLTWTSSAHDSNLAPSTR